MGTSLREIPIMLNYIELKISYLTSAIFLVSVKPLAVIL